MAPTVIWKGAHPRNFHPGRKGRSPEAIVLHVMDGSLAGTDAWFNNPASRVSAHYGIGKDGEVHQYVKETDAAFHAGTVDRPRWPGIRKELGLYVNPNLYTIGIEHEGRGASLEAWPEKMKAESLALVARIARRWNIPLDDMHVIAHRAIRSSKPDCPGRGLDLDDYIRALRALPKSVPAPRERPFAGKVRIVRPANVRPEATTQTPAPRKLLAGDSFAAVAVVAGESVSGNANWFRSAGGEHVWAGNTDQPFPP